MIIKYIQEKRKSISIQVLPHLEVIVKYPIFLNKKKADEFLELKKKWLEEKIEDYKYNISNNSLVLSNFANNQILNNGRFIPFTIDSNLNSLYKVERDKVTFQNKITSNSIDLKKMYSELLYDYSLKKLQDLKNEYNLDFRGLKIMGNKSRWGSCSSLKKIQLHWKLQFLETNLIDSVIIHEFAHLKYLNHSKEYYQFLMRLNPDFKKHRLELKKHAYLLNFL